MKKISDRIIMKNLFITIVGLLLLSGCGMFVTKDSAKYAKVSELCMWGNSNMASDETINIAWQELARRNKTCNDIDEVTVTDSSTSGGGSGLNFNPSPTSVEMMRLGSELMIQGAPRPLYVPPPPPAPIRCQTIPVVGGSYQTICR